MASPLARIGLAHVVEGDLAVVAHQHVRESQHRDHALAPVGPVDRVRDVDVHLDAVAQPVVAVGAGALLEQRRLRHRRAQLLLGLRDGRLLLARVLAPGQAQLRVKRVLQERHPDAAPVGLVEVLVEEDHVGGELPGGVVGAHARGQASRGSRRSTWSKPSWSACLSLPTPAEVVDPQHVVVLGGLRMCRSSSHWNCSLTT